MKLPKIILRSGRTSRTTNDLTETEKQKDEDFEKKYKTLQLDFEEKNSINNEIIRNLKFENENLKTKISKLEKYGGKTDFSAIKEKLKAKIELLQTQLLHIEEAERILSEV